jgi:superoxide reductase
MLRATNGKEQVISKNGGVGMKFAEVIQTADWKAEKHVPVIVAPGSVKAGEKFMMEVSVGKEITHPNTTEHHIRSIRLYFKPVNGKFAVEVGSFEFSAHAESPDGPNKGPVQSEPTAHVILKLAGPGTLLAVAYCNIHGLWESSQEIKVGV